MAGGGVVQGAAALPLRLQFSVESERAAEDGGPTRFRGVAYSGGVIPGYGFYGDSAIDVNSLSIPDGEIFALTDHDPTQRAGRARLSRDGMAIRVEGYLFQKSEAGRHVADLFAEGAPWQFSVGLYDADVEVSDKAHPVDLNGRTLEVQTIFRNATIREVSFVPIAADPNTTAEAFGATNGDQAMPDDTATALKTEIDALRAELTAATATIETLRAESAARDAAATEAAMTARRAEVRALFEAVGMEHSDEAAAPYVAMDAAAFAAVSAQMKQIKPEPSGHLFNRAAKGGRDGEGDGNVRPVINTSAIYSARAAAMGQA